jgi:hypothetical protein
VSVEVGHHDAAIEARLAEILNEAATPIQASGPASVAPGERLPADLTELPGCVGHDGNKERHLGLPSKSGSLTMEAREILLKAEKGRLSWEPIDGGKIRFKTSIKQREV